MTRMACLECGETFRAGEGGVAYTPAPELPPSEGVPAVMAPGPDPVPAPPAPLPSAPPEPASTMGVRVVHVPEVRIGQRARPRARAGESSVAGGEDAAPGPGGPTSPAQVAPPPAADAQPVAPLEAPAPTVAQLAGRRGGRASAASRLFGRRAS